jgi:23S rRNA (uracil1939-C5)-methyltransferase
MIEGPVTIPAKSNKNSDLIGLNIESMAFGGKGVGRDDGKVWFVDGAIVGDEVICRPTSSLKRYGHAEIVSFEKKSPLRTASLCQFQNECGGCQWLDVEVKQQNTWKKEFVLAAFKRIGKLSEIPDTPIIGSPETKNYRNRITLQGRMTKGGNFNLGYHKRNTHDIVDIDKCIVAHPAINEAIERIKQLEIMFEIDDTFRLQLQVVETQTNAQVLAVFYPENRLHKDALKFIQALKDMNIFMWCGSISAAKNAQMIPFDQDFGVTYYTIPGQFQQINRNLNSHLRKLIFEIVESAKPKRLLDVFCGNGNLSLGLLPVLKYLEGVESNSLSIACANRSIRDKNSSHGTYIHGDAVAHLRKCAAQGKSFDLVILDPPRQGMHQGILLLKKIAPKDIVYVSCDPNTLARDLGELCKDNDYKIDKLFLLDFFPHTFHIETLVHLTKQ